MEGVEVGGLNIIYLVGIFLGYLISHMVIGLILKKKEAELKNNKDNEKLIKEYKFVDILFKWYPFLVLFVILIGFLF